jgi:hypothetical protein
LAKLALLRFEEDRQIDGARAELRRLLEERAKLSAEMRAAAAAIDFTLHYDSLDQHRFEQLLASLAGEMAPASERWRAWFFGESQEKTEKYIVRARVLCLAETLASPRIYERGQVIALTEEEGSALLSQKSDDGPVIERALSTTAPEPEEA